MRTSNGALFLLPQNWVCQWARASERAPKQWTRARLTVTATTHSNSSTEWARGIKSAGEHVPGHVSSERALVVVVILAGLGFLSIISSSSSSSNNKECLVPTSTWPISTPTPTLVSTKKWLRCILNIFFFQNRLRNFLVLVSDFNFF